MNYETVIKKESKVRKVSLREEGVEGNWSQDLKDELKEHGRQWQEMCLSRLLSREDFQECSRLLTCYNWAKSP